MPFFYLVYRAWSHWRALSGSKHIEFLLDNHLITPKPSQILDEVYSAQIKKAATEKTIVEQSPDIVSKPPNSTDSKEEETMVLSKESSKLIAKALDIPELEVELDRAIWQVETKIKGEEILEAEKKTLDKTAQESKATPEAKERE